MRQIEHGHRLRQLLTGVIEQVFNTDLGVADPLLIDYISSLLSDFVHVDSIFRMRTIDGRTIRDAAQMEALAYLGPDVGGTQRTFLVNRFIGDFTLFWAGVYPESLNRPRANVNRLREYLLQGKRSYGIASELVPADQKPPPRVLRNLSEQFEFCVHGLHRVRLCLDEVGDLRAD